MLLRYFVNQQDPDGVIYEINFSGRTWRVVGADPETDIASGELEHDGRAFLSPLFTELEIRSITRSGMTFYHAEPTAH